MVLPLYLMFGINDPEITETLLTFTSWWFLTTHGVCYMIQRLYITTNHRAWSLFGNNNRCMLINLYATLRMPYHKRETESAKGYQIYEGPAAGQTPMRVIACSSLEFTYSPRWRNYTCTPSCIL
jgi:hypothetical protein